MSVGVIESGERWANIQLTGYELESSLVIIVPVREIVDGGGLGAFAMTAAEAAFVGNNQITTIAEPIAVPSEDGYDAGNLLIGL